MIASRSFLARLDRPLLLFVALARRSIPSARCPMSGHAIWRECAMTTIGSGRPILSPIFMAARSEEHTSELQSLMRISYAVFCLKKKTNTHDSNTQSNAELHQSL